ncbi:MAG: T9SS type A sorting domain-containing protein, partial [Bacteroidia bacterium]|nr:T9SS type A sorting domain-containing protein [Bacteroidia bacterium]
NRIFDGRLSYNKGAMVLHQLRWVIGDSAFFASVNNYLSDSKLAYGFAHTSDLQSHFETAVGQSLNWYFSDWFTGQGYPSYTITWNQNGSSVNITITQTQSHPSVSFFELPIPIELKGAGHDTIVRLNNTFSGQQFTVTIPFTVDSVFFDPKLWLITAHNDVASVFERNMNHACYIFPNPMHNKLKIKFIKEFSDMKVQLVDINGKEVKTVQADGLKAIDIDLDGISHGIYFVHFTSGKTSSAQKIIIQ